MVFKAYNCGLIKTTISRICVMDKQKIALCKRNCVVLIIRKENPARNNNRLIQYEIFTKSVI